MTMHDGGGPRAGASYLAERVASAAGETAAALPADPFARGPRLGALTGHRLSGRPAVLVLASLIVALLASSAAPTPLYAIYQARWHFTPITTTIVFGVYAMAVLVALLTAGKLSDHVGRRPVLLTALAVRFLPEPTHLIYLVMIGVLAVQAIAIAAMRETVNREPGALASLRPEITLPRALRGPVLTAVPVLLAVWALAGLYGALGPALVHTLTGSSDVVLGSLSLFVLAGSAVVAIIALRRAPARTVMLVGIVALIAGTAVTVTAVSTGSVAGFFAGSVIAGIGFGSGFQGGLRTVVPLAAAHERAGVVSLLYVVSYLGLGVPAVVAGYGVVHGGGLISTTRYYGAAVIALALLALIGLLKNRRIR
jgi:MFS family permease